MPWRAHVPGLVEAYLPFVGNPAFFVIHGLTEKRFLWKLILND
jgi:hypothetical protein